MPWAILHLNNTNCCTPAFIPSMGEAVLRPASAFEAWGAHASVANSGYTGLGLSSIFSDKYFSQQLLQDKFFVTVLSRDVCIFLCLLNA